MSILTESLIVAKTRINSLHLIKNLNLWGNSLTDVSILARMEQLEVLSLSVNNISTLQDFSGLVNLTELYLRKNRISDLQELLYLQNLTNLKVLWVCDNDNDSDVTPIEVASAQRLAGYQSVTSPLPREQVEDQQSYLEQYHQSKQGTPKEELENSKRRSASNSASTSVRENSQDYLVSNKNSARPVSYSSSSRPTTGKSKVLESVSQKIPNSSHGPVEEHRKSTRNGWSSGDSMKRQAVNTMIRETHNEEQHIKQPAPQIHHEVHSPDAHHDHHHGHQHKNNSNILAAILTLCKELDTNDMFFLYQEIGNTLSHYMTE